MALKYTNSFDKKHFTISHFSEQGKTYYRDRITSIYFIKFCFENSKKRKSNISFNFLG